MTPSTLTDELLAQMRANALSGMPVGMADGVTLELPPKVFVDMGGAFVAFEEGRALTVRFPNLARYQNPMGFVQGGIIAAVIDNTIGPLSFLVAPPSVTAQLNLTYVRPLTPDDAFIEVEGRVVERTRTQILLAARVSNPAGKLVAIAQATCTFLTT
jgi:uncharacterized protein (TIGR00369 family)